MSNIELAKDPNTSPETLERLAEDENWLIRYFVAQNPNTSPETLERLADDKAGVIHWYVKHNPNTPKYIKKYFKAVSYMHHVPLPELAQKPS